MKRFLESFRPCERKDLKAKRSDRLALALLELALLRAALVTATTTLALALLSSSHWILR
jgi:hypothetical protein